LNGFKNICMLFESCIRFDIQNAIARIAPVRQLFNGIQILFRYDYLCSEWRSVVYCSVLDYDTLQPGRWVNISTFRRDIMPLSSEYPEDSVGTLVRT
jgi:hypothetical protein